MRNPIIFYVKVPLILFFYQVNNNMIMAKVNKIPSQAVQKALQMTSSLNGCIVHVEN